MASVQAAAAAAARAMAMGKEKEGTAVAMAMAKKKQTVRTTASGTVSSVEPEKTAPLRALIEIKTAPASTHLACSALPSTDEASPQKNLVPATVAASAEINGPEKSSQYEDWTVVLPRRGKRNRTLRKFVVAKQEKETQQWTPVDIETDPEKERKLMQKMQTCIQKLATSEFCRSFLNQMDNPDTLAKFRKVLGSEEKTMQIVIYGIGSIESFEPPRLQLSLAVLMKRKFDWIGEIQVFDPIISLTESKVLTSLGCNVLSVNEQGRRRALKPTMFFMPHCEAELYENLLEANWGVDKLNRLIVFGNSFGAYEQHVSICKSTDVANSRKRILSVRSFTEELGVTTFSGDSFLAFHGSSWHLFRPGTGEPFGEPVRIITYD